DQLGYSRFFPVANSDHSPFFTRNNINLCSSAVNAQMWLPSGDQRGPNNPVAPGRFAVCLVFRSKRWIMKSLGFVLPSRELLFENQRVAIRRPIGIIFAFTILCQQRLRCFTFGWNYENPKQWLRRTGALKGDLFPVRRPVRHGRDHGWIRELCAFATVNPSPPKSPIR